MDELARIALVGTAKHPAASRADVSHPAEALLASLATDDGEHAFLLRAGVQAVFGQCGRAARATDPAEPSPAESKPFASPKIAELLRSALGANSREFLLDFLASLDAAGLLLPPEFLPEALDMTDGDVRERLLPLLGERGRWLSRFNPSWRWAVDGLQALSASDLDALQRQWDDGTARERLAALQALRRANPGEARKWLEEAIDKEKAEERAKLVAALQIGISAADEAFLETRLDDRSEQVRALAARMLAHMPDSALARRTLERADRLLSGETTGLVGKKFKLHCTPPEEIDKSWERDGIPRKPAAQVGKRALWAETILSMTPPAHWSRRFNRAPTQLIEAVLEDDFAGAVLAGWTRAAIALGAGDSDSAAWLSPLWNYSLGAAKRAEAPQWRDIQEQLQGLLAAMPAPEAEDAMTAALDSEDFGKGVQLLGLLSALPRPWSEKLAHKYLTVVRAGLKRCDDRAVRLAETLAVAALALPSRMLAADLVSFHEANDRAKNAYEQHFIAREAAQFADRVRLRQAFDQELNSERTRAAAAK